MSREVRVWVLEMLMCEELVPLAGDNKKKKKEKEIWWDKKIKKESKDLVCST